MNLEPDAALAWRFRSGRRRDLLLLCDHASNRMPRELGDLGLKPAERELHIAWDPGAAGIAEAMRAHLDCPAFFGTWSRLVVDLNRAPDAGDLILCENDSVIVHGNMQVSDAERERRIARYHRPYHQAIERHLDAHAEVGPALISIHTYTPVLNGHARPWHAGLLWKVREPWIDRLLARLRQDGLEIGDNEPYDGRAALGFSLDHHAIGRGLRHAMFEVRHDLAGDPPAQRLWAGRLLDALQACGFLDGQVQAAR